MWKTRGTAFITFLLWDYITTVGTRVVVERSPWAVLLSAVTVLFWIYGVRLSVENGKIVPFVVAGVVLGTLMGIIYP